MSDAASFDAIMQCNLLEVFCEALDAAILVTDKYDAITFASIRLAHLFPISPQAIVAGTRIRDLFGALFDAGCRFGAAEFKNKKREEWIAERVAWGWKERAETIEQSGNDGWFRIVSRRFSSGLGLTVFQDISQHKKKEQRWRMEHEGVRITEEILDTLPFAVAVKDSNLNYAAVNQAFCRMIGMPAEDLIGRRMRPKLEVELAATADTADWHAIKTGEERETLMSIETPGDTQVRYLHRSRRVGEAGAHFLSLSFVDLPASLSISETARVVELISQNGTLVRGEGTALAPPAAPRPHRKRYKVVYVGGCMEQSTLVAEATRRCIEVCVVSDPAELEVFLPAVAAAGIRLDFVMLGPDAATRAEQIAGMHGVPFHTLARGADAFEEIVSVLGRIADDAGRELSASPAEQIDIVAVQGSELHRMVLEQILGTLGLSSIIVGTGAEALDRIAEAAPRAVFLDAALPDMVVGAFMDMLAPIIAGKNIRLPVIGLINPRDASQSRACQAAGLVETIVKPLSPEAIDQALRRHLLLDKSVVDAQETQSLNAPQARSSVATG